LAFSFRLTESYQDDPANTNGAIRQNADEGKAVVMKSRQALPVTPGACGDCYTVPHAMQKSLQSRTGAGFRIQRLGLRQRKMDHQGTAR